MYEQISKNLGWTPDAGQLSNMQAANKKKLEEIEEKIKDAEENLGDIEVRDAHRLIHNFSKMALDLWLLLMRKASNV